MRAARGGERLRRWRARLPYKTAPTFGLDPIARDKGREMRLIGNQLGAARKLGVYRRSCLLSRRTPKSIFASKCARSAA